MKVRRRIPYGGSGWWVAHIYPESSEELGRWLLDLWRAAGFSVALYCSDHTGVLLAGREKRLN